MNNPLQAFEIELPTKIDPATFAQLEKELHNVAGVDQFGSSGTRSLDPAAVTMWIQLLGTGITTAAAVVPVVKQILDLFKKKGIKGAKLKLADGTTVEADDISADDLLKIAASRG
jgi:hypothetical protein